MADAASQVLLGSGLTILSQPLMYVKVLIQVGYEPLPPTIGRNIFGRQVCQLPGLFSYAQHIASIDGRRGLFTGLTPRLCSGVLGTVVHGKVLQHYQDRDKPEESGPGSGQKEGSPSFDQVIKETTREMIARSAATLITHPFHVITLRSMVQFIGRESKYCGLYDSVVTIYREEGLLGFFAGLIPRLLGDIISLWLCNSLAYLVNTYALDSGVSTMNEMKSYSQAVTGACRWVPSLLPDLHFLDRLLVHTTEGGKHEPRKQLVFPEGPLREDVLLRPEDADLKMWGRDSDISIVPDARNDGREC
ncbi:mitochondrial carrier homolog 2 isoform X2 [Heterocephalus glaber]|uniref:Mitochondrial carrier homolog 2 isoform X2 n=1 Tax=Heterocephalus glaber TaxID=10181 RepID=A0AAX6TGZ3_HETGA|nr:mitochondrial carrier homolog 2 isoform X2 [Heterocephalus glaber]